MGQEDHELEVNVDWTTLGVPVSKKQNKGLVEFLKW
jgi:hypothetical protein